MKLILLFLSLIVLSTDISANEITNEEALYEIKNYLEKNPREIYDGGIGSSTKGIKINKIEVFKRGSFKKDKNYFPFRVRTQGVLFVSGMYEKGNKNFDYLVETRLKINDYDEWEVQIVKAIRTPDLLKKKERIEKKISNYSITKKNWMQHPEIKEVRKLYTEVESLGANKKLKTSSNSAECYGGSVIIDGVIYKDNSNHPRKLFLKGGTGDSFGTAAYYYDSSGVLRFSFITLGSANGKKYEKRVYFSESGKLIYTNNQFKDKSDGFSEIVKEPESQFNDLCN